MQDNTSDAKDMELKLGDIKQIYGETFFLIEEEGENKETAEPKAAPVEAKVETAAPVAEEQPAKKQAATTPTPEEKPKAETSSTPAPTPTGNITWRTKEASKVLFVLHQNEIRDKELGELLKKIVASIGIPFEAAGFGIVKGGVNLADWQQLPNPYGVVFDMGLMPEGSDNPLAVENGTLFFCNKLDEMKDSNDMKRVLWNYLKGLKEKLN